MNDSPIVLSIHPKYANGILDKTKTVEIRRGLLPLHIGSGDAPVFLYATSPIRGVVGSCTLIHGGFRKRYSKPHGDRAKVSREEWDEYKGDRKGLRMYIVRDVEQFIEPIPLEYFGISHAPQFYSYVKKQLGEGVRSSSLSFFPPSGTLSTEVNP
jgi:predicted transcriptional regulator